jgi:hypothetical protein
VHKGQGGGGVVQRLERLDLLHAADGVVEARSLAFDDVKLDAQRWQWGEDVAEEDDTVRLERTPRLQ